MLLLDLPEDVVDTILQFVYQSDFVGRTDVDHLERGCIQNVGSVVSLTSTSHSARAVVIRHLFRHYGASTVALLHGHSTGRISREWLSTLTLRRLYSCSRPFKATCGLQQRMKESTDHFQKGLCTHVYEDGSRCFRKRAVVTRSRLHSDMKCPEHVLRPDPHRWDWMVTRPQNAASARRSSSRCTALSTDATHAS